jgi:hypothetical protein
MRSSLLRHQPVEPSGVGPGSRHGVAGGRSLVAVSVVLAREARRFVRVTTFTSEFNFQQNRHSRGWGGREIHESAASVCGRDAAARAADLAR